MAPILKLMWGATALDLQGGASGWQLQEWQPKIAAAGRGAGPVVEEVLCIVTGSSHNDLATQVQALHAMQARCRAYIEDQAVSGKVWLHTKLDGETGERRALVRRLDATFSSGWYAPEIVSYLCTAALSIEREPFWEATTATAQVSSGALSSLGGAWDYTSFADVGGDTPARLQPMTLDTLGSSSFQNLWLGFRSAARHGTVANFAPVWEIENGTPDGSGETTEGVVTGGSPSDGATNAATVAFTDTTWKKRTVLLPLLSAATSADQHGRFVLLLRAKVTSGAADVKLKYGYVDYLPSETDPVRISATSWTLYELGMITLPPRTLNGPIELSVNFDAHAEIDVWARRVSGAGNLNLDCIVAVPADEYFIKVQNANVTASGTYPTALQIGVDAVGNIVALNYRQLGMGFAIRGAATAQQDGSRPYGIPVGDGRLIVVAAQANNVHVLTDTIYAAAQWWPRFASLRGSG